MWLQVYFLHKLQRRHSGLDVGLRKDMEFHVEVDSA